MTRINPRVQIGRFCDLVAYRNSRSDIGAEWLPRQIVDVGFLGHIGHFPDEVPVDSLGENFEGDLHPTPEEIGEEPPPVVVKPCDQIEPSGSIPF